MRKKAFITSFLLCVLAGSIWSQGIRKPYAAGMFYEKNPEDLSMMIDTFLQRAKKLNIPSENILALISPHAGYIYSGQVAAQAYSLVKGRDYESVVIIGPSHQVRFNGCSIYTKGGYETPLGVAEVDESLAAELSTASGFKYIPQAHQMEHSLEVQIPFIQKVLPQAKIVPILMGVQSQKTIATLSESLAKVLPGKKVLVIASTDLSHGLTKKRANDLDSQTIALIQSLQTDVLVQKIWKGEGIMCGGGPVVSTLHYALKIGKAGVHVLNYADSSLTSKDESYVVGYLAAAIYVNAQDNPFTLFPEEKKELLKLARTSIHQAIKENKIIDYKTESPTLLTKKGAFVTLRRGGYLRGCIGYIEPVLPLYETVIRAAIMAALKDTRFPPVKTEELDDLAIEISVLSVPKKINDPRIIEVGTHGLIIAKGDKKGLLLPQVPVENNWSREEFLQQTCQKAGLPRDAWKSGAEIYIFETIVFQ